jgi:hypothetical protein
MQKIVNIALIAMGTLFLSGCSLFSGNANVQSQPQTQEISKENTAPVDGGNPSIKKSLLGLIEGSTGVKCSIEDEQGKYVIIAKDKKVKIDGIDFSNPSEGSTTEQKGTMIDDGEWIYMWSGKEGMKFNKKETEKLQTGNANSGEPSDWQGWLGSLETSGAKYDCNPTVATDADFLAPQDVKFQDLGELMKGIPQAPAI